MTLSTSPLHEEVALWRATQQGTVEDFAELDRILSRFRHPDTAIAQILARVAQHDVPIHVAADIDQIVWEQDEFEVNATYTLAPDEDGEWAPDGEFDTEEDARAAIGTWMKVHVVRRIIVESRVYDQT